MEEPGPATAAGAFGRDYLRNQDSRGPVRRFVRSFYLRRAARLALGPALDFGCGAGELLKRLPTGSAGLEVNPEAVAWCRQQGLDVAPYDPASDGYELTGVAPGRFRTFVSCHVLEHLPDVAGALRNLAAASRRLGLRRMVLIVPGRKGFASDATHRTFVDRSLLEREGLFPPDGFAVTHAGYFPFDWAWLGEVFPHHEWTVVLDTV